MARSCRSSRSSSSSGSRTVAALIGVVAIITAVGVRRLRPWARKLGAGLLVGFLARDLALAAVHVTSGATYDPTAWIGEIAWIVVDAIALFILARRWPA